MDSVVIILPNETALVAQAQVEPAAFAAIYDHYFSRVYNYVRYRIADVHLADDLTAQIFERTLARIGKYKPERAPFAAWLFAIARNPLATPESWQVSLPALPPTAGWKKWSSIATKPPGLRATCCCGRRMTSATLSAAQP